MDKIKTKMYGALRAKYEAEMLEAEASLLVYFNSAVGIGEHPQHIEEMDKLIEKRACAKDKLENLEQFYKYEI
jgi:hypothetical protein